MPIYQAATFTSEDAGSSATSRPIRAPATPTRGSPIRRPAALGAAYAELAGAEAGIALASGMGAIHAALASQARAGDRIVAPMAVYGSTRTQLLDTFAALRGRPSTSST